MAQSNENLILSAHDVVRALLKATIEINKEIERTMSEKTDGAELERLVDSWHKSNAPIIL